MSEGEHIAPDGVLFLVAIDDADPEKRTALDHLRSCSQCQELWRESEQVLGLLEREEAALPPLPAGFEQRVHAAVFDKPARAWRWEYWAWLAGALASLGMIWRDANLDRPLDLHVGMGCLRYELGFGLVAFAGGWLSVQLRKQPIDPLRASVFGMTGALVGQLLLRTRCEASDSALHLFAFHLSGVVLATVLSAGASRLYASRTR